MAGKSESIDAYDIKNADWDSPFKSAPGSTHQEVSMAGKSESIDAYDIKNADWDSPFKSAPSSAVGEFAAPGTNAVVADLNANSFSETSRTPYDGDTSRSQGKFRTTDSTKRS
jgi:hypothetical protein